MQFKSRSSSHYALHLVPPPSLGEECLQDVHLQHGHADDAYGLEDCVPEKSAEGEQNVWVYHCMD